MFPKTIILMGRSGGGKGTQAKLLNEYIKANDTQDICYIETGALFREFEKKEGYSNDLAREISDTGGLQPEFLAVWNWSNVMVQELRENVHLIMDGMPRSLAEAHILETALNFYKRRTPTVIHINVNANWAREHMKHRGRTDDSKATFIESRLDWFEKKVMPAIEYYKNNPKYNFVEINGDQTIEKVHEDIIKAINDQD